MSNIIEKVIEKISNIGKFEVVNNREELYIGKGYGYKSKREEKIFVGDGHLVCVGATETGKTNTMMWMMMQDLAKGRKILYIDPKGEMKILESIYNTAKIPVVNRVKDIIVVNPLWKDISARYNPLYIDGKYSIPDEIINRIMASIPETKEAFYKDTAYRILQTVIHSLFIVKNKKDEITFDKIFEYMTITGLKKLRKEVFNKKNTENKNLLKELDVFSNASEDWYGKVSSTMTNTISQMSIGVLYKIFGKGGGTEKSDILKRLYSDKPMIGAILLPSLKIADTARIASRMIFASLQGYISEMIQKNENSNLRIYIDEAKDVLFSGSVRLFTQARSAGVYIRLFTQSIEGLYSVVEESEVFEILQNSKYKMLHRCDGIESTRLMLEILEDVIQQTISQDQSGEMRTMGHVTKVIDANDVAKLRKGEYYFLKEGKVWRGYCPLAEGGKVKLVIDKEKPKEDEISINKMAMNNWLEKDNKEVQREMFKKYGKDMLHDYMDMFLFEDIKKKLGINSNNGTFSYGVVCEQELKGYIIINHDMLINKLYKEITVNVPALSFRDTGQLSRMIESYFYEKEIIIVPEWADLSKENRSMIRVKYNNELYEMNFKQSPIIDCWLIKYSYDSEIIKNDDFDLTITVR